MIILDEGMRLPISTLKKQLHKAILFSLISFSVSFLAVFILSHYAFGQAMAVSFLIAAIFASVAPELLSGFLHALGASEKIKGIGEIEATLSDALSVMAALLIASSLAHGEGGFSLQSISIEIIFVFFLSAACGALFALLWRMAAKFFAEDSGYLFAICLAAVLYSLSGLIDANGVVAVFVFGFFLGNSPHQSALGMQRFHSEITFFLRTFFFLYLGLLLFHSEKPFDIGLFALVISVLLAFARKLSVKAMSLVEPEASRNSILGQISCRGLTPAVLAVVVSEELAAGGHPLAINLPLLAMFVVFFTNLLTAALVLKSRRKNKPISPIEGGL